ncbi:MAG: hypothetical protein U1E67_08975 [Hyphomicrobiales bacterium]
MTAAERSNITRYFEVNNARNQTRDEVVSSFVPPPAFRRLLSPKNHVILGSRGSGKTALTKMVSHSHLSMFTSKIAQEVIETKRFIGLYVPSRLSWLGSQIDRLSSQKESLEQFVWKLNLATAFALLDAVESCLRVYITDPSKRVSREADLCHEISSQWNLSSGTILSLADIRALLTKLDYEKKGALTAFRLGLADATSTYAIGLMFHNELFDPLRRAISAVEEALDLNASTTWLVCLDEIEFLEEDHHRLLNSHMRADSGNMYLKCTTLPYRHYTLETTTEVPIVEKHDFEYVYLDRERTDHIHLDLIPVFFSQIYDRRMRASGWSKTERKTLNYLLGSSDLLDEKAYNWSEDSIEMRLLQSFANTHTIARAKRLLARDHTKRHFKDQIGRKIAPALILRHAVGAMGGREESGIYSGAAMVSRCADANPRMFIHLLNRMLFETISGISYSNADQTLKPVPKHVQNRILLEYSRSELEKLRSEENGSLLYNMISSLGTYMHGLLHDRPLGTDNISSFTWEFGTDQTLDKAIRSAVGIGCVFPSINPKNPDRLPDFKGTFHIGFKFAPTFQILPRKGKSIPLESILNTDDKEERQLGLFLRG